MSEKVKIKSCIDTGKKYQDKPIIEIELSDGRKGSAFDTSFLGIKEGQEVEVDLKPAKEYNGEKRYYFNIPGQQKSGSKFPSKDWTFEKRKSSLENAIEWCKGKDLKTKDVLDCANLFFNYLTEK